MDHPIKRDHARFRKIVKGKIRDNLRKYVSQGQQIIPKGDDQFKVPMPSIDIPRFKFGDKIWGIFVFNGSFWIREVNTLKFNRSFGSPEQR